MNVAFRIRPLETGEASACEAVMRSLPEWFGIEESILQYRRDVEAMETIVVGDQENVIGFLTLNQHNESSAEIHVMAVRQSHHRQGIGGALIRRAEAMLTERNIEYFQVKTVGPSRECREYAQTRKFYNAMGFRPLEENNAWGDANPCLIMVKHLACRSPQR